MRILAIESSCDDTAAAVFENDLLLSNEVAGQAVHEQFGGVVPELASRAHQKQILPVVEIALQKANLTINDINAIAFTKGPGLLGSLLVGSSFAKGIATALNIPLIGVNHMQGHILAHFIRKTGQEIVPDFPFICLTVSGGHTQLVLVKSHLEMEILGETIDDAAGEAFDKAAKILNLPYPGGPLIDKLAKTGEPIYSFTKPRVEGLNFSFSGLKTQFLYFVQNELKKNPDFTTSELNNLCASIQFSITDIVLGKLKKAVKQHEVKAIALAGGVSANSFLRNEFTVLGQKLGVPSFIPPFEYCTDNAAMIGITAHYLLKENKTSSLETTPKARLSLTEF
ncbi:MAG: tRNA (adenosine(37)-N6)-threonylcarbamoyltransferase complex transferase subunit TsaD [Luteibaculaceae bacterium]